MLNKTYEELTVLVIGSYNNQNPYEVNVFVRETSVGGWRDDRTSRRLLFNLGDLHLPLTRRPKTPLEDEERTRR